MEVAVDSDANERQFARLLAGEIARFEPEDLSEECLALQFTLSAYMRSCDVGMAGAERALFGLREALVRTSGLCFDDEPTPLLFKDPRQRLLNLSHYTYGLIGRAAARARCTREAALEAAAGACAGETVAL